MSSSGPPPRLVPAVAAGPTLEPERGPEGRWRWCGRVRYNDALALQESLRAEVRAGTRPDTLLLLEHEPVITLGRHAREADVLLPAGELSARGIEVRRSSRGGDVTFHGPGQLVGYPVVWLRRGVRAHVEGMAAAIVDVLGELGIQARYRPDAPGVWVEASTGGVPQKICAFGINVHHRVAIHGFAFNLSTELDAFTAIVPCGMRDADVTSVARLLGESPSPRALAPAIARALGERLRINFVSETPLS